MVVKRKTSSKKSETTVDIVATLKNDTFTAMLKGSFNSSLTKKELRKHLVDCIAIIDSGRAPADCAFDFLSTKSER